MYYTLNYVAHHAARHNISPIITFDQPLWWKALSIILSQPEGSPNCKVVLRLGTFHMEMSYLGSIGHLMSGSGSVELLELIYALHAVQHIGTGKICFIIFVISACLMVCPIIYSVSLGSLNNIYIIIIMTMTMIVRMMVITKWQLFYVACNP